MDYVTFEGQIEPMEWGRSTYTVLRLPDALLANLGQPKRVEGEIADHPVNLAVTRAPVIETAFLYTGKSLLKAAGIAAGDVVEVRLRAADPDLVVEPDGLAAALRAAGLSAQWQALTPGKRRGLIAPIEAARTATTRDKRIAHVMAQVRNTE